MKATNNQNSSIPCPQYRSWMLERIELPKYTQQQRFIRWQHQPTKIRALDAILSRFMKWTHCLTPSTKYTTYNLIMKVFRVFLTVFDRLKVFGTQNIPKTGCIFYVNHPGVLDPIIVLSTIPYQTGSIIAWGNGWFADMIEYHYGLIAFQNERMEVKAERMIRTILTHSKHFAIWPEGRTTHHQKIEQGFSSIIRVYSVINAFENKIPFVPVLLRGSEIYHPSSRYHIGPIEVHYMEPFFLDRTWLDSPEQGGKTPREMIDFCMMKLARLCGQKELLHNPNLDHRKNRKK